MSPTLASGKIVVGIRSKNLSENDIVIVRHAGLEKIKRIAAIRDGRVFLVGDNPEKSTDSRSFGWLSVTSVRAKLVWPVQRGKRNEPRRLVR